MVRYEKSLNIVQRINDAVDVKCILYLRQHLNLSQYVFSSTWRDFSVSLSCPYKGITGFGALV